MPDLMRRIRLAIGRGRRIEGLLVRALEKLDQIDTNTGRQSRRRHEEMRDMARELQTVIDEIKAETGKAPTVRQAVAVLMTKYADAAAAAADDPAELEAVLQSMRDEAAAWGDLVLAHTKAEAIEPPA